MQVQKNVVRTRMAVAFSAAVHSCIAEGRNPGRIGRHIVTAEARGVGVKHRTYNNKIAAK